MSAGSECHQDLRFLAQQASHILLLTGADSAVEETKIDAFVSHLLDAAYLGVDRHRPEDNVECCGDIQDFFVDPQYSDVTASAGGGPVKC